MVGVIWQNICSFIRLARQKIDWGLWFEGKLVWERWWLQGNNVSLTVQWRLPLTPGLRHDPQRLSRDKTWTFVPFTFGCFKCSYRKATRKGDMIGKEIHSDTLSSSFILSAALRCELGLSVCAPTEVQGNYWNIWMTGPSLNPRTNDAWPLQKGMGRTLLPLTDISHQRSMTSPMLVGWREARDTFGETNLTFMTSKNIVFPTHPTARINVANEHFSEMADPFNFFMS